MLMSNISFKSDLLAEMGGKDKGGIFTFSEKARHKMLGICE